MTDLAPTPNLYYITHIDNLGLILEHGILSHNEVEQRRIQKTTIHDQAVINLRKHKRLGDNSMLDYVNFFFQPRNPMLYRVLKDHEENNQGISVIIVLQVSNQLLNRNDIYLSDTVAARNDARIESNNALFLNEICQFSGSFDWFGMAAIRSRRLLAECLVPNQVDPDHIDRIWVADPSIISSVRQRLPRRWHRLAVDAARSMFFNMVKEYTLWRAGNLFVLEGNMFTSQFQTLTIPVNTAGVMGKGVAKLARETCPRMYRYYQQLCNSNQLILGNPQIFPPQNLLARESIDEGGVKFLLFPTKGHWRSTSKLQDILSGLKHLHKNYKTWGINSLVLPALGCGFGGLTWHTVRENILSVIHVLALNFPVCIYLTDPCHVATEKESEEYRLFQDYMLLR